MYFLMYSNLSHLLQFSGTPFVICFSCVDWVLLLVSIIHSISITRDYSYYVMDRKLCTVIIYDVYIMYWAFNEHLKPCCCNGCSRSQTKKSMCTALLCVLGRQLCFYTVVCSVIIVLCCLYMNKGAS